jgi:uncharacterized membrane protein
MMSKLKLTSILFIATIMIAKAQNQQIMNTQTNLTAPVKCSKSMLINAPAKKVWAVLTDINNWDKWQPEISKPKLNGELKEQASFVWKTGGANIHSTLHTVKPYEAIGWTGHTFGLYAIHNWQLAEKESITQVTVDESMQGFLAGLFKKSFNKNLETGMHHWLEALKKECEK